MLAFLDAHFEEILGAILLAAMVTIAFLNVIVRYCTSFFFCLERRNDSEFLCLGNNAWAAACGFREGKHLAMNIFYNALPRKARLAAFIFSCILCLVFFGALFWTGCLEVIDEYELESISESLGIPVWWYTIATPAFSLLIIFRMLQRCNTVLRAGNY